MTNSERITGVLIGKAMRTRNFGDFLMESQRCTWKWKRRTTGTTEVVQSVCAGVALGLLSPSTIGVSTEWGTWIRDNWGIFQRKTGNLDQGGFIWVSILWFWKGSFIQEVKDLGNISNSNYSSNCSYSHVLSTDMTGSLKTRPHWILTVALQCVDPIIYSHLLMRNLMVRRIKYLS